MDRNRLRVLLEDFRRGKVSLEEVENRLGRLPYADIGIAKVDHHRALRHGFPEVILGEGKSSRQIVEIARELLTGAANLLITRAGQEAYHQLRSEVPEASFHEASKAITVVREPQQIGRARVGVFCAGTADIPVAEEAVVTAEIMGSRVVSSFDIGVAGIHRVLSQQEILQTCSVAIVAAGMEGALPSVVGGLVDIPVVGVPTSVGYGASFQGMAALLGMLNSCASNVVVVNIDNGFGAGYAAALIDRKRPPSPPSPEA